MTFLKDKCGNCGGHGIVADYRGDDFYGPKECPHCANGTIYISENDRVFLWIGGPLAGRYPGRFKELSRMEG